MGHLFSIHTKIYCEAKNGPPKKELSVHRIVWSLNSWKDTPFHLWFLLWIFLFGGVQRLLWKDEVGRWYWKSHCSHLDIYISQKTRLCVVNLEDQFQMSLEAKLINFLIWKFKSIILIFLLFFAVVVKSGAFCTLLLLFQRVEVLKLQFDTKMWLNLFEIALTVSKKHWIWQFLQKIEEKWK